MPWKPTKIIGAATPMMSKRRPMDISLPKKLARRSTMALRRFSYHCQLVAGVETRLPSTGRSCFSPLVFLGGERRCPPENCGSVPGYYDFLDTISGPDKGK